MDVVELINFINQKVPNLTQAELLGPNTAYHYTMHSGCIEESGMFLGRTVDKDMDRSSDSLISKKAADKEGLVCSYLDLDRALEEGAYGDCDIYKLEFTEAVAAYNEQERLLDLEDGFEPAKIIFIPAKNITSFKRLEKATEI